MLRVAHLPDQDLAYLPEGSQHYADYVFAVDWAQRYARISPDNDESHTS